VYVPADFVRHALRTIGIAHDRGARMRATTNARAKIPRSAKTQMNSSFSHGL
jgi:hypothetical protein